MRVAGIDCGTNSIRLLIADVPGDDQHLKTWFGEWRSPG